MSEYKLYYFPAKGRAEAIRILFAYKNIKYEDLRIGGEKWAEFKPKTPFGSMPVLEEGGRQLGGSIVILRYLGEKLGVAGANAWENAQIANISDFVNDFLTESLKLYLEKDETKKAELQKKMTEESVPKYLGKLNEIATNGYLFGNSFTWVDFQFYHMFEGMVTKHPEVTGKFPNLDKLKANVEAIENIAKWLKERPDSSF